jgi:hypothetical protein
MLKCSLLWKLWWDQCAWDKPNGRCESVDQAPMIRTLLLLTIALAVGAHAKPIVIGAFPYTIVAPGNYQVASYLSNRFPSAPGANITINVTVPGKVVLDLNQCQLYPYESPTSPLAFGYTQDAVDVFAGTDVTIQNGEIGSGRYGFGCGIYVNAGANASYGAGPVDSGNGLLINLPNTGLSSGITINNIFFNNIGHSILFNRVSTSVVKNCVFFDGANGIVDNNSRDGNTYINNEFSTMGSSFIVCGNVSDPIQVRADFTP